MVESRIGGDHRAVGAAGAHQHRHRHRGLVSRQGGGQAPAVGGPIAVVLVVLDVVVEVARFEADPWPVLESAHGVLHDWYGHHRPDEAVCVPGPGDDAQVVGGLDRKSTRLNSSHVAISYAVFCLKKKQFEPLIELTDKLNNTL